MPFSEAYAGPGVRTGSFEANVSGCGENGIPFEVYRYTCATAPSQAVREAEQVVSLLMKKGLSCRVWWDVEDRTLTGLGTGVLTGLIRSARNTVEGAGLEFGIYTGLAFYEAGYFDGNAFDCPYWIARYPSSAYFDFETDASAGVRQAADRAAAGGMAVYGKGTDPRHQRKCGSGCLLSSGWGKRRDGEKNSLFFHLILKRNRKEKADNRQNYHKFLVCTHKLPLSDKTRIRNQHAPRLPR